MINFWPLTLNENQKWRNYVIGNDVVHIGNWVSEIKQVIFSIEEQCDESLFEVKDKQINN